MNTKEWLFWHVLALLAFMLLSGCSTYKPGPPVTIADSVKTVARLRAQLKVEALSPPKPEQVLADRKLHPFVFASAEVPTKRLVATVPVAVTVVTNGRTLNVFILPANIMPPLRTPKLLRLKPLTPLVVTGPHGTIIPFTDGPDSYIAAYWDNIPVSPKVEIQSGTVGAFSTIYSTPWPGDIDVLNVTRKSNLPVELLRLKVQ